MTQELIDRYSLLRTINLMQPVGRRLLAEKLGVSERSVRTDLEALEGSQLVAMQSKGVVLTPDGERAADQLLPLIQNLTGIHKKRGSLENQTWFEGLPNRER
ncbi:HTH domain-containing protein [Secundilactobacillus collinoides]|uniref:HTH domain-containing protein n=1 Tax=Secundilactobacillus collinoides TaxID=33960 RepID=UPI0015852E6B|nr:HTH domain-containing protein [Secundilactobacillus collinoides]